MVNNDGNNEVSGFCGCVFDAVKVRQKDCPAHRFVEKELLDAADKADKKRFDEAVQRLVQKEKVTQAGGKLLDSFADGHRSDGRPNPARGPVAVPYEEVREPLSPADEKRMFELKRIYVGLMQAMVKGTQFGTREKRPEVIQAITPVGLRHGVAAAQAEAGALARLLIKKNLITELEYWEMLVETVGEEVMLLERMMGRSFRSSLIVP